MSLSEAQSVQIASRRGSCRAKVRIDGTMSPGLAFMSIHYNELFAPSASPNEATSDATDPVSKQPALKACAVSVCPAP